MTKGEASFKRVTLDFKQILNFISLAPKVSARILALKNVVQFRNVELELVDQTTLCNVLMRSGAKWNASQSPMGGTFFEFTRPDGSMQTTVLILKDQDIALASLIFVHEMAHVRDHRYALNRKRLALLASELKIKGSTLLAKHKLGHKTLASELSELEKMRKRFDSEQINMHLKAEYYAFEETRHFIEEISQNREVDFRAWVTYITELRQKGNALFTLPGEFLSKSEIDKRYLTSDTVKNRAA